MLRLIISLWLIFLLSQFDLVENKISIKLHRQKTARENALRTPDFKEHGINTDWARQPVLEKRHNQTNDSIALFRYLDMEFYGLVVIGSPGKTFKLAFDTAWGTSWVMSSTCSGLTSTGCWFHNKYNHKKSSTSIVNGTTFIANEGSYNLTGFYVMDTVSIAHSIVFNQTFVEMVEVPQTFLFSKCDGLIGLGLKVNEINPFFYNLLNSDQIKEPIFSIFLNRDKQSSKGGNIELGFINKKHIAINPETKEPEEIKYLPINPSNGFWEFHMDRVVVTIAKKSYPFCESGCNAISDSSNNVIVGPKKDVDGIHELLNAVPFHLGRFSVTCDTVMKLPPIDFVLDGKNFTLKPDHYVQKMSLASFTVCLSAFVVSDAPSEIGFWILGGSFLSEFYSIYDIKNYQIGFVRAA